MSTLTAKVVHPVACVCHERLVWRCEHHLGARECVLVGGSRTGLTTLLLLALSLSPGLSHLFEFARTSFRAMFLHCDVSVEMVQRTVALLTARPRAGVQPLDFVVSSTRALTRTAGCMMTLRTGGGAGIVAIAGHVREYLSSTRRRCVRHAADRTSGTTIVIGDAGPLAWKTAHVRCEHPVGCMWSSGRRCRGPDVSAVIGGGRCTGGSGVMIVHHGSGDRSAME